MHTTKRSKPLAPLLLFLSLASTVAAEPFPADSNILNVRTFGAKGDGVADDSAAILLAIQTGVIRAQTIYFPDGVYRVSRSFPWKRGVDDRWGANLALMGQSREGTIIRLIDRAPGFSDPNAPRGLFVTGSTVNNSPVISEIGGGNEAFRNSFYDLTIDVGAGNPGAIGIDWVCSNRAVIRNVTVRSSDPYHAGAVAIDGSRIYPGPCLIQDVELDGFKIAYRMNQHQFSMTLVDVQIRNQTLHGIDPGLAAVHIENLVSVNRVPALKMTHRGGFLTVVGLRASGGDPTRSAIEVPADAHFFLRDIKTRGYRSFLLRGSAPELDADVDEYVSDPVQQLFPGPKTSLRLPIERAPEPHRTDGFAAWIKPRGTLSTDAVDDAPGIQAALDSGKSIVYLPHSPVGQLTTQYALSRPLTVPCSVRRIIGMENFLVPASGFPAGQPAIRVAEDCPCPLTIERFWAAGGPLGGGPWIEHTSSRDLYLRDLTLGGKNPGLVTRPGAGKAFLDDVGATVEIHGTKLWARQLNPELKPGNVNDGGDFWALGMKTEQDFVTVATTRGRTEILGGFFMPGIGTGSAQPELGFTVVDGQLSVSYVVWSHGLDDSWKVHVREQRGGEVRELPLAQTIQTPPVGGTRGWVPLFVSR
jgi:hypothetical protein